MSFHSRSSWLAFTLALIGAAGIAAQGVAAASSAAATEALSVTVAEAAQRASGIQTTHLAAVHYRPQVTGYGEVLDPTPLLTLRAQWQAGDAALFAAEQEYLRLKGLNRDGQNISVKRLQAARAAWQQARARLAVLHARALLQWGPTLSRWLERGGTSALDGLARGNQQLLRISAPGASYRVKPPAQLKIGDGLRAVLVSAAPRVNPEIQAPSYFYRAASALPVDFQFTVDFPVAERVLSGVEIPRAAVVWYAGAAWVYLRCTDTGFERRRITTRYPHAGGWFVPAGVRPGEQLVVQGAELLFADEFSGHAAAGAGDGDD